MQDIKTKDNLGSDLKTNIKIVNKNLEEKRIKIQSSLDVIVNLQNWRDSNWCRFIVVFTISLFCSKKRVINKIEVQKLQASENLILFNETVKTLLKRSDAKRFWNWYWRNN